MELFNLRLNLLLDFPNSLLQRKQFARRPHPLDQPDCLNLLARNRGLGGYLRQNLPRGLIVAPVGRFHIQPFAQRDVVFVCFAGFQSGVPAPARPVEALAGKRGPGIIRGLPVSRHLIRSRSVPEHLLDLRLHPFVRVPGFRRGAVRSAHWAARTVLAGQQHIVCGVFARLDGAMLFGQFWGKGAGIFSPFLHRMGIDTRFHLWYCGVVKRSVFADPWVLDPCLGKIASLFFYP